MVIRNVLGSVISSEVTIHVIHRGKGVEGFSPAPLVANPLLLPVTGAEIIGNRVAMDVTERVLAGGNAAGLSADDGKFPLEVDLRGDKLAWNHDRGTGIAECRRIFEEKDGITWNLRPQSSACFR